MLFFSLSDVSSSQLPAQENLLPLKRQLFPQNFQDPIELQTESRIEIIPRINHNNEHSSKHLKNKITKNLLII
jgi:hypothetical protein